MNSIGSEEIPHSRSERPLYSSAQLSVYFTRIGLPISYLPTNPVGPIAHTEAYGLDFLNEIMRHHLTAIPCENLSMHYSHNRGMTLDMQEIYSIFTDQGRGRGGHCLQMNGLFGTVLSSLGFHVTTVAARVNTACQAVARNPGYKGPSYNGWDHMVNIVTLSSRRYLVDVGMGARGPMVPLEMVPGTSATSISPRTIRLLHGCIPEHTSSHPSNALWKLEMRNSEGSAWVPTYAFTEIEFLPQDFEVINWYVNMNIRSWFTHKILVVRMVLDTEKQLIIGDVTLFERTLVKRIHGQVEVEIECRSEQQRVDLLRTWFGIILTDSEQKAIISTVSQIP